jgi:hypothetical protein
MPAAKTVTRPARTRPATTPKRTVRPKTRAEARPVAVAAVKAGPARSASKPPKLHRKPVRDSFTMPEADFALIATLKARALAGKRATKKSELLRAGLHALAALDAAGLMAALAGLAPVKVGRPKKAR